MPFPSDRAAALHLVPHQCPLSVSITVKGPLPASILPTIFGPWNNMSGLPRAFSPPPHSATSCPSLGVLGAVPSSKKRPLTTDCGCLSPALLAAFLCQAQALHVGS